MPIILTEGHPAVTKSHTDTVEELDIYSVDSTYEGWYCVRIIPTRCSGCGFVMQYLEPDNHHLVLVWEESDDDELLDIASRTKADGLDPHIVEYEPGFGAAVEYKEAKAGNEVKWLFP